MYDFFIFGELKKMKDTKETKEQLTAELVESEEKYRILVEMASDCIHIETIEGRILECNAAPVLFLVIIFVSFRLSCVG